MHELVIIETGHIDARFKHEDNKNLHLENSVTNIIIVKVKNRY